jgi:hypothetical protein
LLASFVFSSSSFSIQSGGPNAEYGGGSISQSGNIVSGLEANGALQFLGTFSAISWTNPDYEYFYAFTAGVPQGSAVPIPGALPLFMGGLALLGLLAGRKKNA